MKLSPRQEAAASASKGGMFVSAAAGSGKTRMLTERFVRLVDQHADAGGDSPLSSVVAITFTDKAAGELAERIRGTFAAYGCLEYARHTDEAWISTIHGLCARILRRHAFEAGLDPRFTVADEVDAGMLRQQAFERAARELADGEAVRRLIVHYNVAELAECARDVDEQLRSIGTNVQALKPADIDLARSVDVARIDFADTLLEMTALGGRKATEEKNIRVLRGVLEALLSVDPGAEDAGALVLDALVDFKQSRSCRECAKPLAERANTTAACLRQAAVDHASVPYADAFLRVLERYGALYEAMKDERGVLDFEDLQLKIRDLLLGNPGIARAYREGLDEVMVDEFQDTNGLQVSVVEVLAGDALATVGDDKQSIYGWRNADVEVFRQREAEVVPELRFELPENYRSHPDLVSFFNTVFSAEPFWRDGFMRLEVGTRERDDGSSADFEWSLDDARVRVTLVDKAACSGQGDAAMEAVSVANYFAELAGSGVHQKDMVLLLRAMTHVDTFEAALRAKGFDVFVASGGTYFDTPEAEELEALLRTIANSADDEAFARLLVGRMAALSDDTLLLLRRSACGGRSLWEAATDPGRPVMPGADETALGRLVEVIARMRDRQGTLPLYHLIHEATEQLDYDLTIFAGGRPRAWANTLKFARMASQFEQSAAGDPSAFLDYLEHRRTHKRYEQQAATAAEGVNAVRIMTVHGAKGLEFPVVAVAGLGGKPPNTTPAFRFGIHEGSPLLGVRLPDLEPFGKDARDTTAYTAVRDRRKQRELEEAKRVFYVACTRASQALALFGTTQFEKAPDPAIPIDWVRTFLDLGTSPEAPGVAKLGGVPVEVVCITDAVADEVGDEVGGQAAECGPEPVATGAPPEGRPSRAIARNATRSTASPGGPRRISYTGLSCYRACGLRYFATHVARIGVPGEVGVANQALAVGVAVHQALRLCRADGPPAPERIAAISRHAGLDEAGSVRVREAVAGFCGSELAKRAYAADTVLHEVPFGVTVGQWILDGSIDLMARTGTHTLVVDYKTGRSQPDNDTLEHWRLQSACYALAVLRAGAASAEVAFVQPEVGGATRSFEYRAADAAGIEAEIAGLVAGISAGVFEPLDSFQAACCNECPAAGILCAVPKRSQVS